MTYVVGCKAKLVAGWTQASFSSICPSSFPTLPSISIEYDGPSSRTQDTHPPTPIKVSIPNPFDPYQHQPNTQAVISLSSLRTGHVQQDPTASKQSPTSHLLVHKLPPTYVHKHSVSSSSLSSSTSVPPTRECSLLQKNHSSVTVNPTSP